MVRSDFEHGKSRAGKEVSMLGRTHFVVGIAAGLAVCHPGTLPALLAGIGVSALGGVLPDIDSGTSTAHKDADRIMAVCAVAAGFAVVSEAVFHVGLYSRLVENEPHRSFMHSIPALVVLAACILQIFPDAGQYFAAGFASHLLIDLLNRRRVRLFYPLGKGFCLNLCSSRGLVNRILFLAGIAGSVLLVLTSVPVRNALLAVSSGILPEA